MRNFFKNFRMNSNHKYPFCFAFLYILAGSVWVLFSGYLIPRRLTNSFEFNPYHFSNLALFIAVNGVLIFLLFRGKFNHLLPVEKELAENKKRLEAIISNAPIGLWVLDPKGVFAFSEGKGLKVLRTVPRDVVGKSVFEVYRDNPEILENSRRALAGESFSSIVEINGMYFESWYSPILDQKGQVSQVIGVAANITDRKKAEEKIQYQSLLDPLTALPNRRLFSDRLQQALLTSQRENQPLAILIIDMIRFKEINNTLGPQYGDMALQQIGNRLKNKIRKSDTISRLGGDQFAILLPRVDEKGALLVANNILKIMEEPFVFERLSLEIEARIGIALYPEHGEKFDKLLRCAEVAMDSAKEEGTGYAIYKPVKDQYTTRRLTLMGELRHAIENNQLFMVYQPKINLKTGRVVGVEALVRWKHPQHGIIPPDQFIPMAENSGLIKPLSIWIINNVLGQCQNWKKAGIEISVAINLSRRNLHDPNLFNHIVERLNYFDIRHEWLELEITESIIMANVTAAIKILSRLNELGIQLSIDDFGTGYSSLGSLKKLPVNITKIDKSFVINMATDKDDEIIVRSTIDLAHNLGLKVVAEGVENQETWNRLAAMNCDQLQGYYISRPLPPDQFIQWLDKSPWGFDGKNHSARQKAV